MDTVAVQQLADDLDEFVADVFGSLTRAGWQDRAGQYSDACNTCSPASSGPAQPAKPASRNRSTDTAEEHDEALLASVFH
jgi:hypothetical protein